MFVSIDRLPQFDPAQRERYRRRWEQNEGRHLRERVLELIRAGAGEDFLQGDFEAGRRSMIRRSTIASFQYACSSIVASTSPPTSARWPRSRFG